MSTFGDMVKATDLRIGNRIYSPKYEREFIVGTVYKNGIGQPDDDYNSYINESDLEGIALSEEWLERLGFDRREPIQVTIDTTTKEKFQFYSQWSDITPIIEKNDDLIQIKSLHCNEKSCVVAIITTNEKELHIPNIRYVHQLQNLIYSLTGQELTLSEKATAQ